MALDRQAVVLPDLDVHSDDATLPEQLEHRRVQHESAAVGHTALDHDVRAHLPEELLHQDDVLRQLDHGDAQPGQLVAELLLPARAEPEIREDAEPLVGVDVELALLAVDDCGERPTDVEGVWLGPARRHRCVVAVRLDGAHGMQSCVRRGSTATDHVRARR